MQSSILTIDVNQAGSLAHPDTSSERQDDAALSNRIEALRVLVLSLLKEIDALGELANTGIEFEFDLRREVHRFEAQNIKYALIRTGGRQRRAARLLNMKVATLNAKIKRYHLDADELINTISHRSEPNEKAS